MNRSEWSKLYRLKRVIARVTGEAFIDSLIYGTSQVRMTVDGMQSVDPSAFIPQSSFVSSVQPSIRRYYRYFT